MTNLFFTQPGDLLPMTKARSSDINALAAAVTAAFNKLPTPLALQSGTPNFAADTGTVANAYLVAMDPTVVAYTDGLEVKMRATRANTGAATVRVNALAAAPIKRVDGSDPQAGDIPAGSTLPLVYSTALGAFCLPAVVIGTLNAAVTAAAQSVTNAANQVTAAQAQAQASATSATNSANSATASANSATASATSAAASEASRILGDKRFLGNKAVAPTVDNQGAALQSGAAYYDTALAKIQVWNGAAWTAGIGTIAGVSSLGGQTGDLPLKTVGGISLLGAGDIVPNQIQRFARVANTQLVAADKSKWLSLSGTFTQTFDTVANLGQGWFIYITNNGTGNITIPLSDGVASWIMYPNETRLFVCDGTAINSILICSFAITFAVSTNFIKPPGYTAFDVTVLGAGGGGGGGGYGGGGGGGGGGCTRMLVPASVLPSSSSVTIGAGGTGGAGGQVNGGNGTNGSNGGDSRFNSFMIIGKAGAGGMASPGAYASVNGVTPSIGGGYGQANTPVGFLACTASGAGYAEWAGGLGAPGNNANASPANPGWGSMYGAGGGGGGSAPIYAATAGGIGRSVGASIGGGGAASTGAGVAPAAAPAYGGGGGGQGSIGGNGGTGGGGGGGGANAANAGQSYTGGNGGNGEVAIKGII